MFFAEMRIMLTKLISKYYTKYKVNIKPTLEIKKKLIIDQEITIYANYLMISINVKNK